MARRALTRDALAILEASSAGDDPILNNCAMPMNAVMTHQAIGQPKMQNEVFHLQTKCNESAHLCHTTQGTKK